jgi:hypothetical protein
MDNDEALILLAAACRSQIDMLEKFIAIAQRHREIETLPEENAELRRQLEEKEKPRGSERG